MEMSKLQIIALVILTTILTDKFLINHPSSVSPSAPTSFNSPQPSAAAVLPTPPPANTQNELILKEIQNLRKDMTTTLGNLQTKSTGQEPVPTLSSSLINGMVKISSPQWKKIDVYEKASVTSKIITSITYDTIYFYGQKNDSWYQLSLDGGQIGWVQSQFLKEYP